MRDGLVEVAGGIAALVVIWVTLQPPDHVLHPDDVPGAVGEEDVVAVLLVKRGGRRCHGDG